MRLEQLGRAAEQLLRWLDSGAELAPGTATYIYFGPRILPGWAIELVLIAALVPFLIAAVDLFARCRRRRIPLAPGASKLSQPLRLLALGRRPVRALRARRLLAQCALGPAAGRRNTGNRLARPGSHRARDPERAGWLVTRARLVRRRPVSATEELAGTTGALLALGVIALLVVATNPFALVFLLPSLHAWLWLPNFAHQAAVGSRARLLAVGFLGPLLLLGSLGLRYDLGLDAPWYLAGAHRHRLRDACRPLVIAVGWLARPVRSPRSRSGRYAPYPSASERAAPRGPVREAVSADRAHS